MAVAGRIREAKRPHDDEKRMELTEHLGELRSRLMRCALYLALGGTLCYFFFPQIYHFLFHPMQRVMDLHQAELVKTHKLGQGDEWKIVFTHFTQAFFVVLKIAVVAGCIVTSPLLIMEAWGFVAPALTRDEKKPLRYLAPFSVVLFMAGVALAYWVAQFAIGWFASYVTWFPHGVLYQEPEGYVMFMLKMMGIFGLVFQLPIALMFLAWVGILRSENMKKSWRTAVVLISVVGLFVTPSNDAFTMLVMIIPVIFLYLGSIWLVRLVERRRERKLASAG